MFTAPWSVGGREVGRLSAPLAAVAGIALGAIAIRRGWRDWALDALRNGNGRLSRLALVAGTILCALVLSRVTLTRFHALDVNAWDFSLYFDRPIERTLHGELLYSDFLHASTLSDDSCFLLLGFVPLYALKASPLWLVVASAAAIAVAGAFAFLFFRASLRDDVAAVLLAAAFVASSATARAVQYVFHPEIFYPAALFLCAWAWARRRPGLFAAGVLITLLIKEDAILPIAGLASAIMLLDRRWKWSVAALVAAAAMFAFDTQILMPRLSASGSAAPWYSWYWADYGSTPLRAAAGMVVHPSRVAHDVSRSGVRSLVEPLLYLPLVGFEWLLASLPALIPYSVARQEKLAQFRLYYSMPVYPFLFAGAVLGLKRAAGRIRGGGRLPLRAGSILLLLTCALNGAGYKFESARPEEKEILPLLASVQGKTPAWIQGSLLPHAGYSTQLSVLDRPAVPDGVHAFLVDSTADPYPFSREELARLIASLRTNPRYRSERSPHDLVLFVPASTAP